MPRATHIAGPIQTGKRTGNSNNTIGTVPAIRRTSVSADGAYTASPLPPCDIVRMWINTETAWEGSAGTTTTLRVGTSSDNSSFGSVVLSAAATRDVVVCGANLRALTSGQQIIVDVTTVGTAGVGTGSFYIEYLQTPES